MPLLCTQPRPAGYAAIRKENATHRNAIYARLTHPQVYLKKCHTLRVRPMPSFVAVLENAEVEVYVPEEDAAQVGSRLPLCCLHSLEDTWLCIATVPFRFLTAYIPPSPPHSAKSQVTPPCVLP